MSTDYCIYRLDKPTDRETKKLKQFLEYERFYLYEYREEFISLFRSADSKVQNLVKSPFAKPLVLPETVTDFDRMYAGMGFSQESIQNQKVYITFGNSEYSIYSDGEETKHISRRETAKYDVVRNVSCIAVKMECLWDSGEQHVYPDREKVDANIPQLKDFYFAQVNNTMLSKAEIPFLIFDRNKRKCFLERS